MNNSNYGSWGGLMGGAMTPEMAKKTKSTSANVVSCG